MRHFPFSGLLIPSQKSISISVVPKQRPFLVKRRLINAGLVVIFWVCACLQVAAQSPSEYQLKAAFIYNFLQFVEWPAETLQTPGSPIILEILGDDPFGAEIDKAFQNKTVNGHPVVIQRHKIFDSHRLCHVVFICKSERDRSPQIVENIGNRSIFSIGDFEDFADRGGVVNFLNEEGKLRFEINLAAVKRARLQVSSKLLRLARIVGKKGS